MAAKPNPPRRGQKARDKRDGTPEVVKYVRMPQALSDAVVAYQKREMMATDAEAIRDLLKRKLREEGLL